MRTPAHASKGPPADQNEKELILTRARYKIKIARTSVVEGPASMSTVGPNVG